jgi:hypothetical protein
MSVHLVQEILFIASGLTLAVVAAAITLLVITQLIVGRGQGVTRRKRQGREEPPVG